MHIKILTVGDNKFSYLKEGEALYIKRISRYADIEIDFVKPEKITKSRSVPILLKSEAERIRSKISGSAFVCALDRRGKALTSKAFAQSLQTWQNRSISNLVFCIGGPLGLDDDFVRQADFVLSLSNLTFPHDLVPLIFLEQLYRAWTLVKGEKYHK
jgi:23S rRNA (pseudouridine1915-N3)-methyltransferase